MAYAVAQLVAALEDPDAEVRCAAAKSFSRGVCRGDPAAVQLLARRTEDTDEDVRLAAVEGLAKVSSGPDKVAATAVLKCLQDADEYVRRAAVREIGSLVAPGDQSVLEALVDCLGDDDDQVRGKSVDQIVHLSKSANSDDVVSYVLHHILRQVADERRALSAASFEVLERLGKRGDTASLDAALACAESAADDGARSAAICAIKVLADLGDSHAMATVQSCLREEEDVSVRCAALTTLASLAPHGDEERLLGTSACLAHSSQKVREAALSAISEMAEPGESAKVSNAIRSLLLSVDADPDPDLECSVLKALAVTCAPGDEHSLQAAEERLEHEDCDVRRAAVEAMGTLAGPRHARAFAAIVPRASDADEDVRCAAVVAMGKLSETRRAEVVPVVTRALADADRDVRREAASVLAATAPQGDEGVLASLSKLLQDEDESVRTAAVHSLMFAAGARGTESRLQPLLLHTDAGIRCTSLAGLGLVTDPEEGASVERLAALLEDSDEEVRSAAGEVLVLLSRNGKRTSQEIIREAVIRRVRHRDADVRVSSLGAAMELYPHDLIWSTRLLLQTAEDTEKRVRESACRLLADLRLPTLEGCEACSETEGAAGGSAGDVLLCGCMVWLNDTRRAVQQAGIQLLVAAWPEGCEAAAQAAHLRLTHQDAFVRRAALECYVAVTVPPAGFRLDQVSKAERAVARSAEVAACCLLDADELLRNAAVAAFGAIFQRCAGQPSLTDPLLGAISPSFGNQSSDVRCSGVEALAATAERGDEARTAWLVKMTQDNDPDVRWSALRALGVVAKRGCCEAVQAARISTKDGDEQIRIAAIQALAQVAEKGDTEVLKVLKSCLKDSHDVTLVATSALLSLFPDRTAAEALSGARVL